MVGRRSFPIGVPAIKSGAFAVSFREGKSLGFATRNDAWKTYDIIPNGGLMVILLLGGSSQLVSG